MELGEHLIEDDAKREKIEIANQIDLEPKVRAIGNLNSPRTAALQVANSMSFTDTKPTGMLVKWVTGVGIGSQGDRVLENPAFGQLENENLSESPD